MTTKAAKRPAKKSAAKKTAKAATRTTKPERQNQFDPAKLDTDVPADDPERDTEHEDTMAKIARLETERKEWERKSKAVRKRLQAKRQAMREAAVDYQQADQHRKDCKAAFDKARAEFITEANSIADGQELLPFPEEKDSKKTGAKSPVASNGHDHAANEKIAALLTKNIKKTVGSDVFENEKIGLTDSVIEKLEGADIKTIGDLEKRIRGEDGKFLNQIPGVKNAAVDRISLTLLAYRSVYPVPAEPEMAPAAESSSNGKPHIETVPKPDWEQATDRLESMIKLAKEVSGENAERADWLANECSTLKALVTEQKSITESQSKLIDEFSAEIGKWKPEASA